MTRTTSDHPVRSGPSCRLAALALFAASALAPAQAVPVAPGASVLLPGTTLAERPDLAGVDLVADSFSVRVGHPLAPLAFGAGWQVRHQVVRSDATGALVMSVQLIWDYNIAPADFLVDAIWLDGWGGFEVDADYRTDLSGDRGPTSATRSDGGDRLELGFAFPLFSGNLMGDVHQDAMPIVVATDATAFDDSGVLTVVGRFSDRPGETFVGRVTGLAAPVAAPVPEPAAWATMALGLAALGTALRRRRGRTAA